MPDCFEALLLDIEAAMDKGLYSNEFLSTVDAVLKLLDNLPADCSLSLKACAAALRQRLKGLAGGTLVSLK